MMLSDVWCLSVWRLSVAYIGPKSRTEKPRKTKIGIEIATSLGHHFQGQTFKGQGHQAALLTVTLTREAGVAVTVRTNWAWETTVTLRLLGGARGDGAPTGEERGGAYRVATRTACCTCYSEQRMNEWMKGYSL